MRTQLGFQYNGFPYRPTQKLYLFWSCLLVFYFTMVEIENDFKRETYSRLEREASLLWSRLRSPHQRKRIANCNIPSTAKHG